MEESQVPRIKSYVPYYRVFPSDTELFPLTVGQNVNLDKLHAVLIVCKKKYFSSIFEEREVE
jgi:hypothetical protein